MFSGVLNERHANALRYDSHADEAALVVAAATGKRREQNAPATLLLDAAGFLVGVDVRPNSDARVVVMLGPHEAVNHTKDAKVTVIESDGELAEVRVGGARAAVRAADKSPYA